jgi:ABC-type transporter Mla MlaB component
MNVLVIGGNIVPADIPAFCRRAYALLEDCDRHVVICDVGAVVNPDAVVVDALARLQLIAKRLGGRITLLHAGSELQQLLCLMGLADVLPVCEELGIEASGQTKEGEHPPRIEEEADPSDPTV